MSDIKKRTIDEASVFKQIAATLAGPSNFIFPKAGSTKLRLVPDPEGSIIRQIETSFRGKPKTKYLTLGYSLGVEGPIKVKVVVLPRSCVKAIVSLQAEGYSFYSEEGHGISIVRTGEGFSTTYQVVPSPKPIPLPPDFEKMELPKLSEAEKEYAEFHERVGSAGAEESEQPDW